MDDLFVNSRLAKVSGWGAGLGVLFACFNSGPVNVYPLLEIVDALLATFTLVSFILFIITVVRVLSVFEVEGLHAEISVMQIASLFLCSVALLLAGFYILACSSSSPGAVRTTSTIGVVMAGLGMLLAYKGLGGFFRRDK
ncbi:hypothetical protein QC590_10440 [Pseudomonas putida]|uniref:hypothetical protein n=1 Tax=Pseudomonas putida TaxID=303 RepID=UPI00334A2DD8